MKCPEFGVIAIATLLAATFAHAAPTADEVPFQLVHGFAIVVQGRIGSTTGLNFLVDTGAVPSVLNQRLASQLGVKGSRGPLALLEKGKEIDAQYATVQNVHLGRIHAATLPMAVLDLAPLEDRLGIPIDAVVGLDLLGSHALGIDYEQMKLTFGHSGARMRSAPVDIRIATGAPYWVIPIRVNGRLFCVLLDTGADNLVLFSHQKAAFQHVQTSTDVRNPHPMIIEKIGRAHV